MRRARDLLIALLLLGAVGAGVWVYMHRDRLGYQLAAYRIGQAETFDDARTEIRRVERGPNAEAGLAELVAKWGTGNAQFDYHLARYVRHKDCSEALRRRFSLELGWREELLPRWAHFWAWEADLDPDRKIESIAGHLAMTSQARPNGTLSWRDVLDLQAVFTLSGEPRLAVRLKPDNWHDRFVSWLRRHADGVPHVQRPDGPLPDWNGPVPR